MSCRSLFSSFFQAAIPSRPLRRFYQIFQEDGKWSAIEKLNFWFLNSVEGRMNVQKGHFRFGLSLTKCNMAAKRIYLSKKELSNLS